MTAATSAAKAIAFDDSVEHFRRPFLHPVEERRPEVKAHPGVVVAQARDLVIAVQQSCPAVGRVAFARDALIPIVERRRRILDLDGLQPRVFARRLIEMAVDADVSRLAHDVLRR